MQTFNEYQKFTKGLAVYNDCAWLETNAGDHVMLPYVYPVMALAEEAGEVNGKVAKFVRKSATMNQTELYEARVVLRENVLKELGDVAYQLSESARQFGFTLQEVIDANVSKLNDRQDRGVLVGEGDNR